MISLQSISKSFSTDEWPISILSDASLEVKKWDFVAMMGPSWSGKSTLLHIISWLDHPTDGSVLINNQNIYTLSDNERATRRWKNISFIFQAFHLLPHLTVEENIMLPLQLNGLEARYSLDDIIAKVWLEHRRKAFPFTLSWWEQQRVAIARAFIWKTPILLADEPTGNLDSNNAQRIITLIKDLHTDTGTTVILITHDEKIAQKASSLYRLQDKKFIKITS